MPVAAGRREPPDWDQTPPSTQASGDSEGLSSTVGAGEGRGGSVLKRLDSDSSSKSDGTGKQQTPPGSLNHSTPPPLVKRGSSLQRMLANVLPSTSGTDSSGRRRPKRHMLTYRYRTTEELIAQRKKLDRMQFKKPMHERMSHTAKYENKERMTQEELLDTFCTAISKRALQDRVDRGIKCIVVEKMEEFYEKDSIEDQKEWPDCIAEWMGDGFEFVMNIERKELDRLAVETVTSLNTHARCIIKMQDDFDTYAAGASRLSVRARLLHAKRKAQEIRRRLDVVHIMESAARCLRCEIAALTNLKMQDIHAALKEEAEIYEFGLDVQQDQIFSNLLREEGLQGAPSAQNIVEVLGGK